MGLATVRSAGWSSCLRFLGCGFESDNRRHADIETRVAPIVVSVFPHAIDLLLRRTPQHRQATKGIVVGRADLSESIWHGGFCARAPQDDLQRGESQPGIGFPQLIVEGGPVRFEGVWADEILHDALACGTCKLVKLWQAALSCFCHMDHCVVVGGVHFPGLLRLQRDSKERASVRMCDLAKSLFGKMSSAPQPLFMCIERLSLALCGEFTCVIAMDTECELMLKRPAER